MTFHWWYVLVVILPLPNLWSIWHIWTHEFDSFQQKVSWLCFAVFIPVIAGLVYIFWGRRFAGAKISLKAQAASENLGQDNNSSDH
ncbi:MAG: PLDc_N domain-containing protein [Desulfovibrionaceae bacterium]|nr:PLDc_N domain-containing protein [Desulfovibrionaceae bacterium]